MRMTVQTLKLLQDGGAPEYMYHDRTAWRFAFFVGKKYGCSKGYPQRNTAHMGPSSPVLGWNLPFRCLHIMHSGNSSLYGLSHRCFIPLCLLLQGPIDLQVLSGATYKF
jgi:hypothetical protein